MRIFVVGLMMLGLAGCSFAPDYQRPQMELPQAWKDPGKGEQLDEQWWKRFDDSTLNALVQEALIANRDIAAAVGATALVSAVFNLAIGLLGIRGAKNPYKITLFFWITLADAVLTAWAMASNLSSGIVDVTGIVSGLFIIALAVCTWQVRGQTGYFDDHP